VVISEEKYKEYYDYIINNESFSYEKKYGLLSILIMYNSIYEDDYLKELEEFEYDNGIYILSEHERICKEIDYLFKCLVKLKRDDLVDELYSISSDFISGEDFKITKKRITLLQLEVEIEPKFISAFRDVLNDLDRDVKKKTFER